MIEQSGRHPDDGPIALRWEKDEWGTVLIVNVTHAGQEQSIRIGAYNAFRVFALLAFMLRIKLPANITGKIKFQ